MSNLKRIDIMKRGISLALFIFGLWINISAQKFVVVNVTPKGVCISGKVIERKDTIDWNEKITWLKKENCSMVVMPLNDIKYKDKHGRQQEWLAFTKRTVSAIDGMDEKDNFFWWLVYNTAMTKGGVGFNNKFYMYEDELVIELPNVLKEGEGYQFVSLFNGKSFYCDYDDEKPLIYITRKMLDSIGFDGKSIRLKVLYINNYNPPKEITDSMIIINE